MKEQILQLLRRVFGRGPGRGPNWGRGRASGFGLPFLGRYTAGLLMAVSFALALAGSFGAATLAVRGIEHVVARDAEAVLAEKGLAWAEVATDGLLLTLRGEAASEAARFRALSAVSTVVAAERVIDEIRVAASVEIAPPRFQMEILRNGLDISLIGLIPASLSTDAIVSRIEAIDPEISVVNMLEAADHPVPFGWEQAADFGLRALALIPSSKISVSADQVEVSGLAGSERQRDLWREQLMRERPRGLIASISISAPRPVISPFTLRFVMDEVGARFDACAADSTEARAAILRAGRAAGAQGAIECVIGLGSPSPRWQVAAAEAIGTLSALGEGSVTLADMDVSLIVPHGIAPEALDRAAAELEQRLPDVFSLQAVRLPPDGDDATRAGVGDDDIEFVASRGEDGVVLLRGHLIDERSREAVQALARAEFGMNAVRANLRIDPDLPEGWPVRALLAVDMLGQMDQGTVRMRRDRFDIRGVTGDAATPDRVSRLMTERLGSGAVFALDIRYDEQLDPVAMQPTPGRCEDWIAQVVAEQKITFDPGSATIDSAAGRVMDRLAEILRDCGRLEMEVAGHTDSQGRLETNMRLSQQRAEAVIAGLLARGALVSDFVAKGYGPEFPVADNSTADGREANRRIEFRLIGASAAAAAAERGEAPQPDTAPAEARDETELEIEARAAESDTPRAPARPAR
jgi:OmpA-OmpF porin, OOP family